MQILNRMRIAPGLAAICLFLLGGTPLSAAAHDGHMAHGSEKAAKAELGTSAAFDAQGRLWIASREAATGGQYVVLQMSADMGKTWSAPQRIQREPEPVSAEGENRPKIAFGKRGELYVTYTKPLAKPYTGEIRFARSTDGGKTFAAPVTVHANRDVITHRFDSLIVDRDGRVYVAWIDKRDVEAAAARKKKYAGAALYYAVSDDGGASFKGDYKIADHSCECCRIALALNPQGRPVAMWRQIFAPNARDHALAELTPDGKLPAFSRVTFDDWRIDACPHHGPSLAFAADGTRHQVWFNVKGDEGGVFYTAADTTGKPGPILRLGSAQAEHADVAVQGEHVVLAWKQFDGKSTAILAKLSGDGGHHWRDAELARTEGASDQPRLLNGPSGIVLVWRTANEGVQAILTDGR
jgi:hypothetical protein